MGLAGVSLVSRFSIGVAFRSRDIWGGRYEEFVAEESDSTEMRVHSCIIARKVAEVSPTLGDCDLDWIDGMGVTSSWMSLVPAISLSRRGFRSFSENTGLPIASSNRLKKWNYWPSRVRSRGSQDSAKIAEDEADPGILDLSPTCWYSPLTAAKMLWTHAHRIFGPQICPSCASERPRFA